MGATPKWLVYNGKSLLEMDDLGATPFQENPHMIKLLLCEIIHYLDWDFPIHKNHPVILKQPTWDPRGEYETLEGWTEDISERLGPVGRPQVFG